MSDSKLSPMQEEIFRRIDSIFSAVVSTAERAGQFAAEQLPDIAMQYIAYGRIYYTAVVALCLIIPGAMWYFWYRLPQTETITTDLPRRETPKDGMFLASWASSFIGMFFIAVNIKEFILVWAAPKVWLLMEIAELARKVKG